MTELVYNNEHLQIAKGFGVAEFGKRLEEVMGRPSEERKKKSFAPSGLGYSGSCPRYWYYAFNGGTFEFENDGPSISNMNQGTDAGARIAKMIDKAGMLVEAEAKAIYDDPPIFGYIDAIVNWKDENIIAEVKTTKDATWQVRASKNSVPGYQMLQLLIYMYVTGTPRGFFITENKNTNQLWILPVRMTDENKAWVEEVFDWMRMVKKNADEGELPTRPYTKSSMQCKGCALKKTCWEGVTRGSVNGKDPNPGTVTLPALVIPK